MPGSNVPPVPLFTAHGSGPPATIHLVSSRQIGQILDQLSRKWSPSPPHNISSHPRPTPAPTTIRPNLDSHHGGRRHYTNQNWLPSGSTPTASASFVAAPAPALRSISTIDAFALPSQHWTEHSLLHALADTLGFYEYYGLGLDAVPHCLMAVEACHITLFLAFDPDSILHAVFHRLVFLLARATPALATSAKLLTVFVCHEPLALTKSVI